MLDKHSLVSIFDADTLVYLTFSSYICINNTDNYEEEK